MAAVRPCLIVHRSCVPVLDFLLNGLLAVPQTGYLERGTHLFAAEDVRHGHLGGNGSAMVLYTEPTITSSEYSRRLTAVSAALRYALVPGILVVMPGSSRRKLQLLAEALGEQVKFLSVGSFLVQALLEVPRARRSQKALQLLSEKLFSGPCCFYDLEILFDPGMTLDVLTSLKTLAKGRELYVDWPGEWKAEEQCLTFAEPEDPAYRAYPVDAEVGVVDLSGETYPALEF